MDDIATEISERGAASVCPGRKTGSAVDDGIVAELLAGKLGLVKIYDDFAVNPLSDRCIFKDDPCHFSHGGVLVGNKNVAIGRCIIAEIFDPLRIGKV